MEEKNEKESKKKSILFLLIFIFIILFIFIFKVPIVNIYSKNNLQKDFLTNKQLNTENAIEQSNKKDSPITFTMTAIGDTLCHNTQYWDAYNKETGEYDFSYVYEDIEHYTKSSDITIGSLETTFAGEDKGYSNYPTFNTPDSLATALKNIGLDVVSLAGNHALDYGYTRSF